MAQETIETNSTGAVASTQKSGGKKRLLIIAVLFLVVGGGGAGGFYFWRTRAATPAVRAKGKTARKPEPEAKPAVAEVDESDVKNVIELQPFIVNLADKNETRYLRLTVSLGVGESGEAKVDPIYTTKVRNAILGVITNKTSDQVLTVEGKASLRKEILIAAQAAVEQPEVHAIYITDFIVQM